MSTLSEQISREELLKAIHSIRTRAETQPEEVDNLEIFVPLIDFAALSTPNTNVIYGRNGTGKTHILSAYYEECEKNFERNKVLPVYVDLKTLELGPSLPTVSLEDLLVRFYQKFLHEVIERLARFSSTVLTPSLLEKWLGSEAAERTKSIDESLGRLRLLLSLEQVEERIKEYVKRVEAETVGASEVSGNVALGAGLSMMAPELQ